MPSKEEIAVATDALRKDAAVWEDMVDEFGRAVSKLRTVDLGWSDIGIFTYVKEAYDNIHQVVSDRCQTGMGRLNEVGHTLRTVADKYDAEEDRNEHKLRNLY